MTLKASSFDRALDYKVIYQDDVKAAVNVNAAAGPCTLHSVIIDNNGGSAACYAKIADGYTASIGASTPQLVLRCAKQQGQVYVFPDGVDFPAGINFWVTSNADPQGTAAPSLVSNANTIKITLTVS